MLRLYLILILPAMGINTAIAPHRVDRNIQLWCWVQGDDHNETFGIGIAGTKTVDDLKKAIRKEKPHAFREVDADTLKLWKVSHHVAAARCY